ncbi:hypothetical protein [Eudoraea sp.]|uniref:hypothetical protein n=1 Tax=Eudoraea sp. TaxID=1979955 RepID=UPI003C72B4B0
MKEDKIEDLFKSLKGSFDLNEPEAGHKERFLEKLDRSNKVVRIRTHKRSWWKPLSIAASLLVLIAAGATIYMSRPNLDQQLARISPEVSQTQFYFASLVEDRVRELENVSTPETQKLVDDTMLQLKKLEIDYTKLERDLIEGGNSNIILSAMITNFQTRIDLLQEVMNRIETIKNYKPYDNENLSI